MKRFIGFVKKEFYHIFRDKRSMFILFGMPIAQIMLFGFAITNEINNVDLIGNCKAKKHNLSYGHPKQNEHRAFVTKNVIKFLFYKTNESFHFLFFIIPTKILESSGFASFSLFSLNWFSYLFPVLGLGGLRS